MVMGSTELEVVDESDDDESSNSSDDESSYESEESELDVDDGDLHVELTLFQSWLSMIPLTKYWWEARRADRALHNIKAMHQETARAKHLVGLVEAGLHEDALREQMNDTDMDFFQFNKVKHAMEEHGQWKWQKPRHLMRTAEATGADRGGKRVIQRRFNV